MLGVIRLSEAGARLVAGEAGTAAAAGVETAGGVAVAVGEAAAPATIASKAAYVAAIDSSTTSNLVEPKVFFLIMVGLKCTYPVLSPTSRQITAKRKDPDLDVIVMVEIKKVLFLFLLGLSVRYSSSSFVLFLSPPFLFVEICFVEENGVKFLSLVRHPFG